MVKKIVVLMIVLSVFMVSCSSANTELPTDPTTGSPVETEAASTEPAELPEVSPTSESGQATEQAEANCTVVSRQPTPGPTEQSLVPAVSDEDWTHGSDDAAVTLIEYGDFQ